LRYLHEARFNGQSHDYVPDFVARLKNGRESFLILETKGYDPLKEIKRQAALRWVSAVNAEGTFGRWRYSVVPGPEGVPAAIEQSLADH